MRQFTLFIIYTLVNYSPNSSFDIKKTLLNKFKKKGSDILWDLKKCRVTHSGVEYEGDVAETKSGMLCQHWDSPHPIHVVAEQIVDSDFPEGSKKKAKNYCRNPGHWLGRPWCYTLDFTVAEEECDIPICIKKECRLTGPGVEYAGLTHYSGTRECIYWTEVQGLEYKDIMFDSLFPDKTRKLAENRCRNPDSDPGGPWCFVERGTRTSLTSPYEKAYCGIPLCDPKACMSVTTAVSTGYKDYHTVFSRLPLNTTSIDFSVKLWHPEEWRTGELRLAIMVLPLPSTGEAMKLWKNGIEIVISTYKSGITPEENEEPDWNIEPGLLSGTRWQDLELAWTGGFITLKIKGKSMSVFTKDYTGYEKDVFKGDFQYYSIKGSHALWNFPFCSSEYCDEKHVTTHGDFERRWPLSKTSTGYELKFFVKGFHTAIVELKVGAMLQYPSVQLTLVNMKRENLTTLTIKESSEAERSVLTEMKIESLLSNWEWREFQLIIDGTRLKLFLIKEFRPVELLSVENDKFDVLRWFSIGSRQSTIYWTLNCSPRLGDLKVLAELPECVMTKDEKEYKGFQSVSASGLTCIPWTHLTGVLPEFSDDSFIDGSKEDARNYCRSPTDSPQGPYCFAVDLSDSGYVIKKEYCFPRQCRSKECKMAGTGNDYIGLVSTTVSNRICQRWSAKSPHVIPQSFLYSEMFPELSLSNAANLCRNPSHDLAGPWCYTTDPAVDIDLCSVPDCDEPGACTIIVKGNTTRQSIYVLPLWRTIGFVFKVKSWDPKRTEGIRFIIRSGNNANQYRLDLGGKGNDKVVLYHNTTEGKEIVVKQKTVGHIIPSGQWAGFVLVLGFGEVSVSYENIPTPFFLWKYIYSKDIEPFLPRYLSYFAISSSYSVGLSTPCEECHTHVTEPGLLENVYPLNWSKLGANQRNTSSLVLFVRGTGTFILVLHRLISDVSHRVLIEVSDYGQVVVKDKGSVLGEIKREENLFNNNSWTEFVVEYTEEKVILTFANSTSFNFSSSKVFLFYFFSISVSSGLLTWSANCDPPNIDASPVNGGWSEWSVWECSVTCGGGHGKRRRKCDLPKPNLFGQPCNGSDVMEGVCNDFKCGDVPPLLYKTISTHMKKQAYNIQKRVGEDLVVPCNHYVLIELKDVSPRTKVEWTKNGRPLYEQERVGNITADQFIVKKSNVNLSDSGIYICALEDRKGKKTAIQLTSVTIITNATTRWSREGSTMVLDCEAAPLTFLFSDLTQFWTLNGQLYQDPAAHWYSLVDIDLLRPITFSHKGEWECVTIQMKYNLTWVTVWFRLGVKTNSVLDIMFDKIFIGEHFKPFGDRTILNSILGLVLSAVGIVSFTVGVFFIFKVRSKRKTNKIYTVLEMEGEDEFESYKQKKRRTRKGKKIFYSNLHEEPLIYE